MIDDEQIEEQFKEEKLVKDVLGMDMEKFYQYKANTIMGFCRFGGSFLQHLGNALTYADIINSIKILHVWRKEAMEHEMVWRIHEARQEAINKEFPSAQEMNELNEMINEMIREELKKNLNRD